MNFEEPGAPSEERIARAKKFVTEKNFTFPVVLDHDLDVGTEYKVDSFPTTFVIDRNGQIRYRTTGYSPFVPEIIETQIQSELAREEKRDGK